MALWLSRLFIAFALIAGVAVSSCSKFDLVDLGVGRFGGQTDQGLIFDLENKLALDIYRPNAPGPHPVLIFWYGGGWQSGSRREYRFIGVEMARRGFVTVLPDYRLYPDVTYPAFVEDAAKAFAWVHGNIADHGGDPARIIVSGHSAGAHIAVMLAADQRFLAARDLTPAAIKGVLGLAGPYHFTPESPTLVKVFNGPDHFAEMQVGRYIDGDEPPMVLLHGASDLVVSRRNVDRLAAALTAHDRCYRTRFYPEVGHVGMIGAFTWAYETEPIVPDVVSFLHKLADGTLCVE